MELINELHFMYVYLYNLYVDIHTATFYEAGLAILPAINYLDTLFTLYGTVWFGIGQDMVRYLVLLIGPNIIVKVWKAFIWVFLSGVGLGMHVGSECYERRD